MRVVGVQGHLKLNCQLLGGHKSFNHISIYRLHWFSTGSGPSGGIWKCVGQFRVLKCLEGMGIVGIEWVGTGSGKCPVVREDTAVQ